MTDKDHTYPGEDDIKSTSLYDEDKTVEDAFYEKDGGGLDDDDLFDEEYADEPIVKDRTDDDADFKEEVAAETAIDGPVMSRDRDYDDDVAEGGTGIGWLSLALSIIGLFFLPVVMGAAGIIVGIIARRQGAKALGAWAIGVGIAAIIIRLFTAPIF